MPKAAAPQPLPPMPQLAPINISLPPLPPLPPMPEIPELPPLPDLPEAPEIPEGPKLMTKVDQPTMSKTQRMVAQKKETQSARGRTGRSSTVLTEGDEGSDILGGY